MAGSNYKLLLEAQLDSSAVQAQIAALSGKSVMIIKADFNTSQFSEFEAKLAEIQGQIGNVVTKISLLGDTQGNINKSVIEYTDALGNAVKQVDVINDRIAITQTYTQNLAKDQAAIVKLQEQQVALGAKQADEMAAAALNADKFLAKSQNMGSNASVAAAVSTAQQIKVAVSEGDIAKVRELNDQLAIQKSALTSGRTAWDSWTFGIQNAIKQTLEYAFSVGLVFGALQQLKSGIQFVADLNKELVNIQVLQATGAQTNQEIGQLAVQFNNLAQAMGATTIEVAQGSTEWFYSFIRSFKIPLIAGKPLEIFELQHNL